MTHSRAFVFAVAALAASALAGVSCGGSSPVTPPTTIPSTTPTTTTPTAPPVSSCQLGQGNPYADCDRGTSRLLQQVGSAMDMLIEQRPQLFDLNDEYAPGTRAYKVVDRNGYFAGLVAVLQTMGFCAEHDVDDPAQAGIFVKESNDYSEEFSVLLSTGHMRRGPGTYRATCTPATFPAPRPGEWPPVGSGCYRPFPPPDLNRMNCKVHIPGGEYATLDSTPIVLDPLYCASVGFPDRPDCPVRPEGAADRVACEAWVTGNAADTGRPGPTWRKEDGGFCTGPDSGCQNGSTQYQLFAYRNGSFTVCARTGRCCTVTVEEF